MNEWISVKDQLPEPWKTVLIIEFKCGRKTGGMINIGWIDENPRGGELVWWVNHEFGDKVYDFDNQDCWAITHWMPLPNPPQS